ncbi:MAG: hypothetical protein AB7F43_14040 [Bacteriovoracia bacterium]
MKRLGVLLSLILYFAQFCFAEDCKEHLSVKEVTELTKQHISTIESSVSSKLDRSLLRIFRRSIRKEVLQRCRKTPCTREQVLLIVDEQVAKKVNGIEQKKAYIAKLSGQALIISTLLGTAAVASYTKKHFPSDFAWIADTFVPIVLSLGIYRFGWSFINRFSRKMHNISSNLAKGKNPFEKPPEVQRLDTYEEEMNLYISPEERRILSMHASLIGNFRSCAKDAVDIVIKEKNYKRAADVLAEILIYHHQRLRFLPHTGDSALRAVQMRFTNHVSEIEVRQEIAKLIFESILDNDPALEESRMSLADQSALKAEYQQVICAWLKVNKEDVF